MKRKEFKNFTFVNFLKFEFFESLYRNNAAVQNFKKNFLFI